MCETIKTDLTLFALACLAGGLTLGADVILGQITDFIARAF